jgi:hypothetical protein
MGVEMRIDPFSSSYNDAASNNYNVKKKTVKMESTCHRWLDNSIWLFIYVLT